MRKKKKEKIRNTRNKGAKEKKETSNARNVGKWRRSKTDVHSQEVKDKKQNQRGFTVAAMGISKGSMCFRPYIEYESP